jgi:hypothetical protein
LTLRLGIDRLQFGERLITLGFSRDYRVLRKSSPIWARLVTVAIPEVPFMAAPRFVRIEDTEVRIAYEPPGRRWLRHIARAWVVRHGVCVNFDVPSQFVSMAVVDPNC